MAGLTVRKYGGDDGPTLADGFLSRVDANGSVLWSRTYRGGREYSRFHKILRPPDGGFLLIGQTSDDYFASLWLVRTDEEGTISWHRTYGRPLAHTIPHDALLAADGDIVAVARSSHFEYSDGWIVKLTSSGDMVWQKRIGFGDQTDDLFSIAEAENGDFITIGRTWMPNSPKVADFRPWCARITPGGEVLWQRRYSKQGEMLSVARAGAGSFAMTGYRHVTHRKDPKQAHRDVWWILIDGSGRVQQQRRFGTAKSEVGTSILPSGESGFIISAATSTYPRQDGVGTWLLGLDADGALLWSRGFDEWSANRPSLRASAQGGFFIADGFEDSRVMKLGSGGTTCPSVMRKVTPEARPISARAVRVDMPVRQGDLRANRSRAAVTSWSSGFHYGDGCSRQLQSSAGPEWVGVQSLR